MLEQDAKDWSLSTRQMLALYGIIPVLLIIAFIDQFLFDSRMKDSMPIQPETWAWWTIVFNIPHIMGSMVTYADKEYLIHYRWPLVRALIISALILSLAQISWPLYNIVLATYTMYHVLMQQHGISLMFLKRRPDALFQMWKWTSIVATSLAYLAIYLPNTMEGWNILLKAGGIIIGVTALSLGGIYFRRILKDPTVSRMAAGYFAGNLAMGISALIFAASGYFVFLILVPRFIHDFTAFAVYAVHDRNRNRDYPHNYIYRVLRFLPVSPAILCIPIAIAISWFLSIHLQDNAIAMVIVGLCVFTHYYMEGYMWRREAPHRRYVPFVHS